MKPLDLHAPCSEGLTTPGLGGCRRHGTPARCTEVRTLGDRAGSKWRALVRSWSMRLGSTVQRQRREFDKRLPDVLSVFLRHMRWLMVRRKQTAMPVLGQGHSPVRRYPPPPSHRAHGNQDGVRDGDRGSTRVGETPGKG